MKLFRFLNSRNVQLTIEIAQKASADGGEYSVYKKAELDAADFIANCQCYLYRTVAVPKLLIHYFLVNLHILNQKSPKEIAESNRTFINQAMAAKGIAAMPVTTAVQPPVDR